MKARVLIIDSADQSTLITLYYSITGFDSWESSRRGLGDTSGDASWHLWAWTLKLKDDKGNSLRLKWFPQVHMLFKPGKPGTSGSGTATIADSWLKSGDIKWQICSMQSTGQWGDGTLHEGQLPSVAEEEKRSQ